MKNWNILSKYSKDAGDLVFQLLRNRGIEDVDEFLNPKSLGEYIRDLNPAFKKSIAQARDLINEAISANRHLIIYGDYDADGISAIAILYHTIRHELGYEDIYYFVPNRFDYGYGLSKEAIDFITEKVLNGNTKNSLWITVDTGITAVDEVAKLKSKGCQVIITDHHQKPDNLPDADLTVWNDSLVGASISWLLSRALESKNISNISYAALATVTDLQELKGFNRSLVKKGLEVLNQSPSLGLKSLLEVSGKSRDEVTTYDLGWIIGPRINASGRIGDPSIGVKLLLASTEEESYDLAESLQNINSKRQDKTYEMYALADDIDGDKLPNILFSLREEYHEGIIGLVAARLTQTYYRPAIVMSPDGEYAKGSVRSIPGINIIEILREFDSLFENLGGHPMAAGFTVKRSNIDKLQKSISDYINNTISEKVFVPSIEIDMEIPSELINMTTLNDMEKLQPHGIGNREPLFVTKSLGVSEVNMVGKKSNHLSLKLFDGMDFYKAIYFNYPQDAPEITLGEKVDVAYILKKNVYRGNTYVNLFIKDIRIANNIDTL